MVYVKDNINLTTLSPTYSTMDNTDCQLCKCFVGAVHHFVPYPINHTQVDGVGLTSAGDAFSSSSLVSAALFVFHRDTSAFASAHGSGPSVHPSGLHLCTQLPGSSG